MLKPELGPLSHTALPVVSRSFSLLVLRPVLFQQLAGPDSWGTESVEPQAGTLTCSLPTPAPPAVLFTVVDGQVMWRGLTECGPLAQ